MLPLAIFLLRAQFSMRNGKIPSLNAKVNTKFTSGKGKRSTEA
jgi:hypothetical protein